MENIVRSRLTTDQRNRLEAAWREHLDKQLAAQRDVERTLAINAERQVEQLLRQQLGRSACRVAVLPGMTINQLESLDHDVRENRTAPAWFRARREMDWMGQPLPDGSRRAMTPPEPPPGFVDRFIREEARARAVQIRTQAAVKARVPSRVQLKEDRHDHETPTPRPRKG